LTANCTYTQVRQIINTSVSDSDITALIALSDAEISDRSLTGLSASALQEISMLLTAEKIVLRDPKTRAAYYTVEAGLNDSVKFASPEDYRAAAERRICTAEVSRGLPIVIGTDDTYR
jgi:hypothetical protein